MYEILRLLGTGMRVLDLGCATGSFARGEDLQASVVRADLDSVEAEVRCDARSLPFAAQSFDAVILNHSLEHFDDPGRVLREIRDVLRAQPNSYLYIAVPDGSTLSDRVYRWLGRGGGHVNQFCDHDALVRLVEENTGLPHVAGRVLFTSFSILNRRNMKAGSIPLRLYLLGGGSEWLLRWAMYGFRMLDAKFGTRTSVYGWACWFGGRVEVDEGAWSNVCIRCGSGNSSESLLACVKAGGMLRPRSYQCPSCGVKNHFTDDSAYGTRNNKAPLGVGRL